jgi:hypothetical protein
VIAILVYAAGFAVLCVEARGHGALRLLVQSLWVWTVFLYAVIGAALCRAIARRPARAPARPDASKSAMISAALRADAQRKKTEGV